jgi:hypothetical protein
MTSARIERDIRDEKIERMLRLVELELWAACDKFKPMNSAHEGFAILKEEVDELWDDIKANNLAGAKAEAKQVAAMAVRFMMDVCTRQAMDNTNDGQGK